MPSLLYKSDFFLLMWLFVESGILGLKLKALILDIIHNIDVVKQLNQAEVHSVEDWAWKKQLRFYMNDQKCYVQMVDAELQYTYEYQVWYFYIVAFIYESNISSFHTCCGFSPNCCNFSKLYYVLNMLFHR